MMIIYNELLTFQHSSLKTEMVLSVLCFKFENCSHVLYEIKRVMPRQLHFTLERIHNVILTSELIKGKFCAV